MLSSDEHHTLVARFYASAMGDVPWVATLAHVADIFGATASLIQVSNEQGWPIGGENHGYGRAFAEKFYASEIYAKDPRVPYYRKVRPGQVYFDYALYDVDEMDRDPYCRATCDALGVKYQLGAVVGLPDGLTGAMTLLSNEKEGHATAEAIEAYRRLAPHLQQAFSLGQILEHNATTQAALLEALTSKADGVILISKNSKPTFMNDAAQQALLANDGLSFCGDSFAARTGPQTRRLQEMICNAIDASRGGTSRPGGQMLVTRPSGKRPYVVRVMPAPAVDRFLAGHSTACVIHLHDLAAERLPSKASLCAVFGLTEREADIAIEVVRCASLASAAVSANMALNTARNHLQSIFRKSGVTNQMEMVQLFSRLL